MKFRKLSLVALWVAVFNLALLANARADGDDFSRIVFFGDSLSDPGNNYLLFGMVTSQPPYDLIPTFPYDIKGFRYTNGKTWTQRFAGELELGKSGKPARKKPGKFTNYAHGGARARLAGDSPSAQSQLALYAADFGGTADPEALYVIQFGGNDLRDALDPAADPVAIVTDGVTSEVNVIAQLYLMGARHFLVANVPDLSLTPAIRLADAVGPFPGFVIAATQLLVGNYNGGLEAGLQGLELMFPDIRIDRIDFKAILDEVVANPAVYGITDTTNACINVGVIVDPICARPNRHVFWDGIHPTRKVHRIVAERAIELYDD